MIIYLVLLLPAGSSDLPKAWLAAFISLLFGLASNGVYMCHCCYQQCGSLLHCLSTLTIAFAMAFKSDYKFKPNTYYDTVVILANKERLATVIEIIRMRIQGMQRQHTAVDLLVLVKKISLR